MIDTSRLLVISILITVFIGNIVFFVVLMADDCNSTFYKNFYSQGKQAYLHIYLKNCGATTRFSTEIDLYVKKKNKLISSKHMSSLYGQPHKVIRSVKWLSNHCVQVTVPADAELFPNEDIWHGIEVNVVKEKPAKI